jgi:hypothetical protein
MLNANTTIVLARKHIGEAEMGSSARLCLADAIRLFDEGDHEAAQARALRSLQFSVGMFHPDFIKAA